MHIVTKQPRSIACASFLTASASLLAISAVPAAAQEAEYPSNQEQHPGEIVYSREVPYGSATRRISQGKASTVAPDQSRLILDTVLLGLEPMSDADQASVSAPLSRSLEQVNSTIETGLSPITGSARSADFTRSEGGASRTGSIVSSSLKVLPSALSIISRTAGSGQ